MTGRVCARIQAHPARSHLHESLAASLGIPTEISLHESDPPSPWAGYRRVLSDLPVHASHVLVVQDDVVPAKNLALALPQVASDVPTALFLARLPRDVSVKATHALKEGRRYVTWVPRSFVPVVALLWPVEKARQFMEWADGPRRYGGRPPRSDDAMVGLWGATTKQLFRATCPSLVQHPDMEPSLIGRKAAWGKDRGRVAEHFCEDATQYEW